MLSLLCTTLLSLTLVSSVDSQVKSTTAPITVHASLGSNVTLPCRLDTSSDMMSFGSVGMRVKWSRVQENNAQEEEEDVLVSMGYHKKSFGDLNGRVFLREADDQDASLVMMDVSADDAGNYRCEVMKGMDDSIQEVVLKVEGDNGVVFPYFPRLGRYNMNFHEAERACVGQGATMASYEQLLQAWHSGMDWCNAGWLSDGTVQYPINDPREPCGGANTEAGIRSYGKRDKANNQYDAFCFVPSLNGLFYWLDQPHRLTYDEAVEACLDDGAEIANVGHMFAAWKLQGYDRCDSGWLADGSVRYPISRPRKYCSPDEAAVRFVGFPDKKQKLYGVYCFRSAE